MRKHLVLLFELVLLVCLVVVLLGSLSVLLDTFEWSSGFSDYISPSIPPNATFERGKTLWDWMDLLVVPAVLGGGVFLLNWTSQKVSQRRAEQQKLTDLEIAADRLNEERLQSYLDRMTELLLEKGLRTSDPGTEIRDVARARTLATARTLDGYRKGILVRFLHESELIGSKPSPETGTKADMIIDLKGVDLSGAELSEAYLSGARLTGARLTEADLVQANLTWANLREANLNEANLRGANLLGALLEETNLGGADLTGVILSDAVLSGANLLGALLEGADLRQAKLRRAFLSGANLRDAALWDADLTEAHLSGATVTLKQLSQAHSLDGAIMPDGTKYVPSSLGQEPPSHENAAPAADSSQEPTVDNPHGEGE
jgi:uncharacterized protein YjbI with pentapeptide repeats